MDLFRKNRHVKVYFKYYQLKTDDCDNMKYMRILAVGFVALLLISSFIPTDTVRGDGIPITKQRYYGTLRENRMINEDPDHLIHIQYGKAIMMPI